MITPARFLEVVSYPVSSQRLVSFLNSVFGYSSVTIKQNIDHYRIIINILYLLFPDLAKIQSSKVMVRAIIKHVLYCGQKEIEEWAEKWIRGENRAKDVRYMATIMLGKTQIGAKGIQDKNEALLVWKIISEAKNISTNWDARGFEKNINLLYMKTAAEFTTGAKDVKEVEVEYRLQIQEWIGVLESFYKK